MNQFLPSLNNVLRDATISDFAAMNRFFKESHLWTWYAPGEVKILFFLRQAGDGTYDVESIHKAVAEDESTPHLAGIERAVQILEQGTLIRITWAPRGLKSVQPFQIDTGPLWYKWHLEGDFWDSFGKMIQGVSYRDLRVLQRLYRETAILDLPPFYLRVLTWAATTGNGPVSSEKFREEFSDIFKAVRSAFDARNPESALWWFQEKGLLNVIRGSSGELQQVSNEPLKKWGFEVEVQS